ncbi:hypothetical protein C7451_12029 [Blastomonas natatoria]|uniref:DUF1178 family protein n=1 Tax=Blastomonas natatoria TaxID=34015 RepID=A0A2V3UPH1_9SPHN|nr:DUF1178 family protein [Blastomonas natatoria]PXW68169.1 hypothetical protein C7451_12029 [Blastomonas natatoria]
MIVYDLKCEKDHVFEVWFASSEAYDQQRERGLVACAFCGSTDVVKAVMAPRLNAKGNQRDAVPAERRAQPSDETRPVSISNVAAPPELVRLQAVVQALADAQARALEQSTWVGSDFADRARAMHYGEEDHALIHGKADPDEAAALIEEGVAVAPLPFPVVPPEVKN